MVAPETPRSSFARRIAKGKGRARASSSDSDGDDFLEELAADGGSDDESENGSDDDELWLDDGSEAARLDIEDTIKAAATVIQTLASLEDRLRACDEMDDKLDARLGRTALKKRARLSDLKQVAQGKDAFGWKSDLYVDDTSPIPKAVQRVVNVISRARALHPSPDKREQLDSGGPARHSRDNVDMTTVIDNMAKKGMPRIIRDLIDLQAMCPEVDISGLAAFINRLEAMTSASVSRRSVFSKGLRRYLAEKEAGDLFLDGSNPGFGWRAALPESSIERVIASYSDRDIELIESIEEKLKSDAVKWRVKRLVKKVRQRLSKRDKKAVELVYNADSVCTLVYGSETTTRELATLVSRVVLRYLLLCGKLWVLAKRDFSSAWLDPIAVFMHLVESVVVAGYVRFRDKDGKPELLGTVDLISGLPHIRGGLSGSSGKVTYLAHEQHGLPASMYNGDDDDDSFGNHGHESFPVNLTRGSWPFPTMWAHLSSRQPALQKLADKLAPVGVLQKVQLPDFEPTKQMEAMWRHNHVDPLDAVARDPSLPQRMKEGLNSAEQEVKNAAAARRQQQADADKTAKAQGRHLMAGRCDTCGIALLSHGTCVACRRDAKRLEGQRKHLQRFEQALRKAKELGYVGNAKPIVRAAEPRAIVPRLPDELNVGYGIQAAAELQETFFSFECARYRRVREKGWAEGTADASICDICVHVERRNSDEFQRRPVCYQCGIDKCREWRKGPVWAAMICLPCWTSHLDGPQESWHLPVPGVHNDLGSLAVVARQGRRRQSLYAPSQHIAPPDQWRRAQEAHGLVQKAVAAAATDAKPADIKEELARLVAAQGVQASASSATRVYDKRPTDDSFDPRAVTSRFGVPGVCLFPQCDSTKLTNGFPVVTRVGGLCGPHHSFISRKSNHDVKQAMVRCLVEVCEADPVGSLKDAFAAAVKTKPRASNTTGSHAIKFTSVSQTDASTGKPKAIFKDIQTAGDRCPGLWINYISSCRQVPSSTALYMAIAQDVFSRRSQRVAFCYQFYRARRNSCLFSLPSLPPIDDATASSLAKT
ncbi:hypothetical protein A1Q1_07484 [Trichosporon asahii var. asahii CBS 2479]|uniref:Uncharacterized protein n=1 Tax=Trichosporon asahii var. asahii (strain ATCC 90039 / CBS 2479 / JCM 2466 / KCTC 7840 / NBRC 103889/ NCYC 2677 / UAMH 7654) TaxID=1186058 RepID=J5R8T3_TRIAS|nr:hypothetical protein A1Q1_07484 [Trichosporon asahii var. asahii CBS 2479]EJT51303.1 hypothetical protein A1Q1_07484 [Trichosporon asahii var. asahii CBS 2479]